jgi:hypothetical protein
LVCIGAFVEAVGVCNGWSKCGWWGGECNGGAHGFVAEGDICCPAIVNNLYVPKSVFEVPPPSDDGGAFKGDFATVSVEEYFALGIAQGCHQEEVVGEAR